MKNVGIKVWVLTGDKIETAINIGYSVKILDKHMELYNHRKASKEALLEKFDQHDKRFRKNSELPVPKK